MPVCCSKRCVASPQYLRPPCWLGNTPAAPPSGGMHIGSLSDIAYSAGKTSPSKSRRWGRWSLSMVCSAPMSEQRMPNPSRCELSTGSRCSGDGSCACPKRSLSNYPVNGKVWARGCHANAAGAHHRHHPEPRRAGQTPCSVRERQNRRGIGDGDQYHQIEAGYRWGQRYRDGVRAKHEGTHGHSDPDIRPEPRQPTSTRPDLGDLGTSCFLCGYRKRLRDLGLLLMK